MENNEKAINQMLTRTMPITDLRVECRSESATPRVLSGYAVRFNEWSRPIWDDWVEMIDPGAFAGCDMSDVIMCTDHGTRCGDVPARSRNGEGTLAIEIDEAGVKFSFEAPDTTRGNDLLELVRRGDIRECSFKFVVSEDRWTRRSKSNNLDYDQRVVMRIAKLYDLSIVVSGAYPTTSAAAERAAVDQMRRAKRLGDAPSLEVLRERIALCDSISNH